MDEELRLPTRAPLRSAVCRGDGHHTQFHLVDIREAVATDAPITGKVPCPKVGSGCIVKLRAHRSALGR